MNRMLRTLLAVWVPVLLIGHGGGSLPCCNGGGCQSDCNPLCGSGNSIEYDVVGDCGPTGRVTAEKPEGHCTLRISGDDVGVATEGETTGTIERGGWTTSNGSQSCSAQSTTGDALRITVRCMDRGTTCTAFFLRADLACDVTTCQVPSCNANERLTLTSGACCPSCVPNVAPTLDASFDATSDLDSGGDPDDAGTDPSACASGRASYDGYYAQAASMWGACTTDSDCTLRDIEDDCAVHCDVPLNEDTYEGDSCAEPPCFDLENALDDAAANLCSECAPPTLGCPAIDLEARCIDQACVAVAPSN